MNNENFLHVCPKNHSCSECQKYNKNVDLGTKVKEILSWSKCKSKESKELNTRSNSNYSLISQVSIIKETEENSSTNDNDKSVFSIMNELAKNKNYEPKPKILIKDIKKELENGKNKQKKIAIISPTFCSDNKRIKGKFDIIQFSNKNNSLNSQSSQINNNKYKQATLNFTYYSDSDGIDEEER